MPEERATITAVLRDLFTPVSGRIRTALTAMRTAFTRITAPIRLFGRALLGVVGTIRTVISSLLSMRAALFGLAAAFLASRVVNALRQTVAELDGIAKNAKALGQSVDTFVRLRFAADRAGVGVEGINTSVRILTRNMSEFVTKGGGSAVNAFNKLRSAGLRLTNEDGSLRDVAGVTADLLDHLARIPNPVERSALAIELFGRSGGEMLKFIEDGRNTLPELLVELDQFGVITDEQARAAERLADSFTNLQAAFLFFKAQVIEVIEPALTRFVNNSARDLKRLSEVLRTILFGVRELLFSGDASVAAAFLSLIDSVERLAVTAIRELGTTIAVTAIATFQAAIKLIIDQLDVDLDEAGGEALDIMRRLSLNFAADAASALGLEKLAADISEQYATAVTDAANRELTRQVQFRNITRAAARAAIEDIAFEITRSVEDSSERIRPPIDSVTAAFDKLQEAVDAYVAKMVPAKQATGEVADEVSSLSELMDGVAAGFTSVSTEISNAFNIGQVLGASLADSLATNLTGALSQAAQGAEDWRDAFVGAIRTVVLQLGELTTRILILRGLTAAFGTGGAASTLFAAIGGIVGRGQMQRFSGGGFVSPWVVPGPDVRRDVTPVLAMPGEGFLRRDAVDYYGRGLLSALNHMLVPREALAAYGRAGPNVNMHGMFQGGGTVSSRGGGSGGFAQPVLLADARTMETLLSGGGGAHLLRFLSEHKGRF